MNKPIKMICVNNEGFSDLIVGKIYELETSLGGDINGGFKLYYSIKGADDYKNYDISKCFKSLEDFREDKLNQILE
jgi:hypothetical protein